MDWNKIELIGVSNLSPTPNCLIARYREKKSADEVCMKKEALRVQETPADSFSIVLQEYIIIESIAFHSPVKLIVILMVLRIKTEIKMEIKVSESPFFYANLGNQTFTHNDTRSL